MIRRLRIKFVCINMTIVTVMLCVIMVLILHSTDTKLEKENLDFLHTVAMAPRQLVIPGSRTVVTQVPYFSLQLGPDGTVVTSGSEFYDLSDRELLKTLIELSAGEKTGVLKDYGLRYLRVVTPTTQRVFFTDITADHATMENLLQTCLLIGAVSFFAFLAISIFLAHWAVRPVETAWEQQRQFVADASHELKTPLSVILSNAQLLAAEGEDAALRARTIASMLTVSQQMKDLVNKLLSCAQVDHGMGSMEFSDVDLSRTVASALLPFDCVFYERGMELDSGIHEDIHIRGSRTHLIQVVDILLDNAQKYGTPQGRTQVSLQPCGKRSCLLAVSNDGPPLSAEELKNIFKRFYRGDASRERNGSYGLGLSIAQSIVDAHRGKIWAESKDSVNTFFIRLPTTHK